MSVKEYNSGFKMKMFRVKMQNLLDSSIKHFSSYYARSAFPDYIRPLSTVSLFGAIWDLSLSFLNPTTIVVALEGHLPIR